MSAMRLSALLLLLLLSGCVTRMITKVQRVPVVERHIYLVPVPQKPEVPKLEPHPGQSYASDCE